MPVVKINRQFEFDAYKKVDLTNVKIKVRC